MIHKCGDCHWYNGKRCVVPTPKWVKMSYVPIPSWNNKPCGCFKEKKYENK